MELINISNKVYKYYKSNVKGNKDASFDHVRRKLTRNIHLAFKINFNEDLALYIYGNLKMYVHKGKVTKIENKKANTGWFYFDKNKCEQLNELLGIKSSKSEYIAVI